ncbi:DUF2946 domain-containing protein [Burkholderia pseudomultivorans]|uniref:Uncharacterized protein n=1 Tax=Burkholderia pseudomultivorans TaxID=1207504 RepID=A0A132EAA5_9BURK|nr:DUF2946 domain-containing protein [Burkholderia pseudomultivorans]KWF21274.1 hypothetical protein WT56_29255 [Burkholderia pseudomultivorans]
MRRVRQPDSFRAGASHTPTRRARATAWLGLFALVLALVAPLISQLRASAIEPRAPFAAICSASGNTFAVHPEPHAPSGTHVDRCGYCGLLAGHPPLQYAVSFSASPAVRHALPEPPIPSVHSAAKRYALAARGPPAARA